MNRTNVNQRGLDLNVNKALSFAFFNVNFWTLLCCKNCLVALYFLSWLPNSNCRFKITSQEKSLSKILKVWRNRGSRGSFRARFMLMHYRPCYLMVLASLFDMPSQVRERLRLRRDNHSLEKFSPALLSFQLQFWKIFLQLHAVRQQTLGFKCNLLFSLCFLLKQTICIMKYCLIRNFSYTLLIHKIEAGRKISHWKKLN